MDILSTIISLISGLIGGNVAGAAMPQKNLGGLVNSITGLIGGGAGDWILRALSAVTTAGAAGLANTTGATTGNEFDIAQFLSSIGVGGVSGGILTAIVTFIKHAIQPNEPRR